MSHELSTLLDRLATGLEDYNRRERRRDLEDPGLAAELEALRRPLHTIGPAGYVRGCPDIGRALMSGVVIPGNYWTQVDFDMVEIACPCGEAPRCISWAPTFCACGRAYAHFDGDVRVYFSPALTLPVDQELEADP